MNYNNLIIFASAVGVPMGLTKYISEWEKNGLWNDIKLVIGQFNTLFLGFGALFICINIFYSKQISIYILGTDRYSSFVILASIAIPFSMAVAIFEGYLKGLKIFGAYAKVSIAGAISSILVTLVLVFFYKLEGAVISLALSSVLSFAVYLFYLKKLNLIRISELLSFNFRYSDKFKAVLVVGGASLVVGFFEQFSQLFTRSVIIKVFGIEANGFYQCVYAISLNYFSILFISLGVYLLPVLSEIKEQSMINEEINSTLKLALILIVPLISTLYIFREQIIMLLYSKDFLPSTDLLLYNFLGDYFKAFSWIIGAWLIPFSRLKAWLAFSLLYYFNFILIFFLLLYFFNFGIKSIVTAYCVAYFIHSVINYYYIVKNNNFKFTKENLKLLIASIIFIIFVMVLSNYSLLIGFIIFIPVVFAWIKISVKKDEFLKVFQLLKNKITA